MGEVRSMPMTIDPEPFMWLVVAGVSCLALVVAVFALLCVLSIEVERRPARPVWPTRPGRRR